jgi:hypothetical protein
MSTVLHFGNYYLVFPDFAFLYLFAMQSVVTVLPFIFGDWRNALTPLQAQLMTQIVDDGKLIGASYAFTLFRKPVLLFRKLAVLIYCWLILTFTMIYIYIYSSVSFQIF